VEKPLRGKVQKRTFLKTQQELVEKQKEQFKIQQALLLEQQNQLKNQQAQIRELASQVKIIQASLRSRREAERATLTSAPAQTAPIQAEGKQVSASPVRGGN
jgi:peptidoglycan hydrolase CwlO-like protein